MTDLLFQIGLSNACFSLALGLVAMVAGAKARRPQLAYMLWLLVFVKLVTPPIVTIPVGMFSAQPDNVVATDDHSSGGAQPVMAETAPASSRLFDMAAAANRAKPWLAAIWLVGSAVVFAWSMARVCRFSRLLAAESDAAPQEVQTDAERTARRLGLNTSPTICTTSARLSPMVWWAGGTVRVVLPAALLDQMDAQQWRWIMAHELAHVRRRDYLVRWLEWLACVCFWWNPVVWWAQRNLRAMEEICCDDLVVSCLNPKPTFYANSLLSAVEFLARPVLRPPAMASEVNSGGFLERRFKMIVSETPRRSNSRWLRGIVLVCAIVVLPLTIVSAQDYEAVGRRLRAAVEAGELTGEQARVMMGALRKASAAQEDQGAERAKAYLTKVKKELAAAVEAGEISREDAARRYEDAQKAIRERMAAGRRQRGGERRRITREDYARAEAELRTAVAEGRVSEEDARARLQGMRKMMGEQGERGERRITIEEYKRAEAKMRKMIEEGKAKPEDVERRLIEMRRMMGQRRERGERGITREDYARAEAELRKLVAEGKISAEDARTRLSEMRRIMAGQSQRGAGTDVDWESVKRRIEGAVESGKMTREEADAKYKEIRERMARADRGADKRAEYERLERRLRAAVEAGKITEEQAREKLEAYRKRLGQER
jgi:beta-lactamase regulating signal transducer with metallopeptidase domain